MSIEKVKLNYMSAVSKTPPVERIPISSSYMEDLDNAIKEKVKQNEQYRIMAEEYRCR